MAITKKKKVSTRKVAAPVQSQGKSLSDFRATHDKSFVVPNKIKEGLAKLGEDGWEYEIEFIKLCGLSTTDFSRFREQFEDYYLTVNVNGRNHKRVWAGSKKLAAKMREMV